MGNGEHGGACWDAYCNGDCDLVKRAVATLQAVVNKPTEDITDEELAAAEEVANILLRAKRNRRCPDCDGEAGEAHVCAPLRDRLEANRAILKARTEELEKVQAHNERLLQAIRDIERMTSDPAISKTAIGARCLVEFGGVPSNLGEIMNRTTATARR
jgi:hypothetical protein